MMTYNDLLQGGRKLLNEHGIADADIDAWYLLAHVFQVNRAEYFMKQQENVPEDLALRYNELIRKRASRIPLQHITGTQEFMGLEFFVNNHVLVPRQDTEILVEEVRRVCNGKSILDMCTGSGCIIVSLAKMGHIKKAVGVDISEKALKVARKNVKKHGVKVRLVQSNLFENIDGTYDVIVSNPPYIPSQDIEELMPEVKDYEPRMALDGLEDGLYFYREIARAAKKHLKKEGFIFFEIGYNQGSEVVKILEDENYGNIHIKKDLGGLERVVFANRC